jgi:hypothetical protein
LLGERIFVPTTLLPAEDVRWEEVDSHTANAHLSVHGESTVLTLEVDDEGRLQCASFPRWNSDPRIGPVGYNTFVSDTFSDERTFGDVTIPTRFRAGWRLGQPDEFPFFFGHITRASFL